MLYNIPKLDMYHKLGLLYDKVERQMLSDAISEFDAENEENWGKVRSDVNL